MARNVAWPRRQGMETAGSLLLMARPAGATAGPPPRTPAGTGTPRGGLVGRQRREHRAQACALVPVANWVVAVQHMQVGRLPGVHIAACPREQVQVFGRIRRLAIQLHIGQQRAPAVRGGKLQQRLVARLVEVAGNLERQPAARLEEARPPGQHAEVAGHPLQHGVGDDHVHAALGLPAPDVTKSEAEPLAAARPQRLRGLDHLGRAVDPVDLGVRPSPGQGRSQRAGTAAEVDDDPGSLRRHPADQIEERPGPLVAEALVLAGIPHLRLPGISTSRHTFLTYRSRGKILMSRDMLACHGTGQRLPAGDEVDVVTRQASGRQLGTRLTG